MFRKIRKSKALFVFGLTAVATSSVNAAITVDTAPIVEDITSVSAAGVVVAIAVASAVIGVRIIYKIFR